MSHVPSNKFDRSLFEIAVARLGLIPIQPNQNSSPKKKLTFLSELASLGFLVSNEKEYNDSALLHYPSLIKSLKQIKGGDVDYVPLFLEFPENTPDDDEYFFKRVIGYLQNLYLEVEDGVEISEGGYKVPEWIWELETFGEDPFEQLQDKSLLSKLFKLNGFGADPITQFQNKSLFRRGLERLRLQKGDSHTEWTKLHLVTQEEWRTRLQQFLLGNLYAASSIKEALKEDLEILIDHFGVSSVDAERVTFKETQTYIMRYLWQRLDYNSISEYAKTPTDLLRMFAALTNTDVSLAETIKFPRFNRAQRRFVMGQLENCSNLGEDLKRYRGLWLEIARYLHVGEFKTKFPQAFDAFDKLRNSKIETFDSRLEKLVESKDVDGLINALSARPGLFARRLHHILEMAGADFKKVLDIFATNVDQVTLKTLLVLDTHFQTIEKSPRRAIINKRGRIRVMDNRQNRLAPGCQEALVEIIQSAIANKIGATKESWLGKSVWIDDRLRNYTIPLAQRKASDGMITVGRGTKIQIDVGKVMRLFVFWKETGRRTDLDLSLIQYDDQMNYLGHISYTQLKSPGIVHSGDLQSAPHGAAEFIDIDIQFLKTNFPECRYIASQIYRYAGDSFANLICHAGWMVREKVDSSYKSFDIKTVQHKFNLDGNLGYSIPILIDLRENEITFVDLYIGGLEAMNEVEGSYQDVSTITRELARMIDTRPNMHALAKYHLAGRGATETKSKSSADVTFGVEDCTYNVTQVEKVLSDLL